MYNIKGIIRGDDRVDSPRHRGCRSHHARCVDRGDGCGFASPMMTGKPVSTRPPPIEPRRACPIVAQGRKRRPRRPLQNARAHSGRHERHRACRERRCTLLPCSPRRLCRRDHPCRQRGSHSHTPTPRPRTPLRLSSPLHRRRKRSARNPPMHRPSTHLSRILGFRCSPHAVPPPPRWDSFSLQPL